MNKHSYYAYIDEAGDEGFQFARRTAEWFIISAAITRVENDLGTLNGIMQPMRSLFKFGAKQEIHFRKLNHERKIPYLSAIAKAKIRSISVAIHKPSLNEQETFQQKNILYFYTCRYLLERISWFCRDSFDPRKHVGDGSVKLVFSKRKNLSYSDLKSYFQRLHTQQTSIEWKSFNEEEFIAYDSSQRMGLQIADAIASSLYRALNKDDYGFREDKYASLITPTMYSRNSKTLGYGMKVWPIFRWLPGNKYYLGK